MHRGLTVVHLGRQSPHMTSCVRLTLDDDNTPALWHSDIILTEILAVFKKIGGSRNKLTTGIDCDCHVAWKLKYRIRASNPDMLLQGTQF